EMVRVFSGINSVNFYAGYDKLTKIFDKTKTTMPNPENIFGFSEDWKITEPTLDKPIEKSIENGPYHLTEIMLDYTGPIHTFRRGRKYIMSGLVKRRNMGFGNFSNAIYSELKIDKLYQVKGGLVRKKSIKDISDKL
ncbi:MAG: hypothetical protein KKA79_08720, partial [Nanoarchaeota archaeon]|nr:hypothetical protein [Nanoarchaeota archaeon]